MSSYDPIHPYGKKQEQYDRRYLEMAAIWAQNSYCKRRQVGALIVKEKMIISDGYNGTPAGFENICEDKEYKTKPYVLHAEANAITKVQNQTKTVRGLLCMLLRGPALSVPSLLFSQE